VLIQVVSGGTAAKTSGALTVNKAAVSIRGFFTNERGVVNKLAMAIVLTLAFTKPPI
jgi:hypothetical protein